VSVALPVAGEPLGPGLSPADVAEGERRLGARLPAPYAELLAAANGYRLRDVELAPSGDQPALAVHILSGIRPPGAGVVPEDLAGYNAYFTAEKGFRPPHSFAFAHSPSGSFVVYHRGARAGRVAFVARTTRKVTLVARSIEDFLSRLTARAPPAIVHASSRSRPGDGPLARVDPPRRGRAWEGVDLGGARLAAGATLRDARAVGCTFGPRSLDARAFTTFERIELVRPTVRARLVMNLVCRSVSIDGCTTGAKPLSLVNVLCDRVRLVGDVGRLFFRTDAEALPRGAEAVAARFYDSVPWALDVREARFRELTLRGIPAHLVLRDPERHAVILTERLAADRAWRRLDVGVVAVLEHALDDAAACHFLCATDFGPRAAAERRRIARLRSRGLVD